MNKKRGFTLIEIIVAVTIFVTVMSIAVGSIISLSRLKIMIVNMKNTQQKARIAVEYVTRYAKEAERISVADQIGTNKQWRTVIFEYPTTLNVATKKISIVSNPNYTDLSVCDYNIATGSCIVGTDFYLIGGDTQATVLDNSNNSYFVLRKNTTSDLEVNLNVKSSLGTASFLNDSFSLNTLALLENLK